MRSWYSLSPWWSIGCRDNNVHQRSYVRKRILAHRAFPRTVRAGPYRLIGEFFHNSKRLLNTSRFLPYIARTGKFGEKGTFYLVSSLPRNSPLGPLFCTPLVDTSGDPVSERGDNSLQDNSSPSLEKRGGRRVSLMKAWEKTCNNGVFHHPSIAAAHVTRPFSRRRRGHRLTGFPVHASAGSSSCS